MTTPSSPVARPRPTAGLRHVALFVTAFEDCVDFYTRLFGMAVEWNPDPDNFYLTSGNDNLALHRAQAASAEERKDSPAAQQRLDHIGFIVNTMQDVDDWHAFLVDNGVRILAAPRTHRDGARSFYCADPDGTAVQVIFHPPLSSNE